jgi:hypothetical protein
MRFNDASYLLKEKRKLLVFLLNYARSHEDVLGREVQPCGYRKLDTVSVHPRPWGAGGGEDCGASENVKIPAFSGHRTLAVWPTVFDCLGCRTDLQLPLTDGTAGVQKCLRGVMESAVGDSVCVLCGSENKQRLFPNTALTDWFL